MKFLTVFEVAELLNVTSDQIYRLVKENRIPHLRVGRYIRIPWPEAAESLKVGASE